MLSRFSLVNLCVSAADTATTNGSSETRLALMKGESRNGTYQSARSNKRIPSLRNSVDQRVDINLSVK